MNENVRASEGQIWETFVQKEQEIVRKWKTNGIELYCMKYSAIFLKSIRKGGLE